MARKTSRKRRKRSGPGGGSPAANRSEPAAVAQPDHASGLQRGYSRSRAKNDAARARLAPLAPGDRPTAVTVGAGVAILLALANLISLMLGYNPDEGRLAAGSLLVTAVLVLLAVGMWRARYWAVLGMQTLLALTIVFAALALLTAVSLWAAILAVLIVAAAGTLFWFLVKAMARIQMPERPGASRGSGRA